MAGYELPAFLDDSQTFIPPSTLMRDNMTNALISLNDVPIWAGFPCALTNALLRCPKLKSVKYHGLGLSKELIRMNWATPILSGLERFKPMVEKIGDGCTIELNFWVYASCTDYSPALHVEMEGKIDFETIKRTLREIEELPVASN